ncbi:FxSxx-COOH system tetratricopeptide repeat protein [Streptomyces griseus]|uniref:FxSxx-COOH system tetratricopeptide repeat protein n=1 Tax=Streptomyces griseus TaxID=1911 RepID=UPI000A382A38|nr:FxSxx-COOH system tetratricopeptide repeat protein [Streptomyces fimicarius]
MTDGSDRITVLFAGQSESWAKWVEEECETAGIVTRLVRWDPLRRPPPSEALTELLAEERVLLVLDDWYLRFDAGRYRAWAAVLGELLPTHRSRIRAVTVTPHRLPEAARSLDPVSLHGVRREEAKQRLLTVCGLDLDERAGVDLDRGLRFPDEPPPVSNVERRNRRFAGRDRVLERLHRLLQGGGGTTASDRSALVALQGSGGIGKTEVAREYTHRYAGDYDLVWWVRSHTPLMAREDFAELAAALHVADGDELRGLIAAAQQRLAGLRQRWLLVFDGAEKPQDLAELIPHGSGHVLITTRDASWSAHGADVVALPRFDRAESIDFVCRRAPRLSEEDADQLAEVVEDLPLLLDPTAAWLEAYPLIDVRRYVADIREGDPHALGVVPSGGDPQRFQAVWSTTLNSLDEEAPHVHELLKLMAHFSADMVPVGLLRAARASDLPAHLARLVGEPSAWNSALRRLSETTAMSLEYETGPQNDILTVGFLRMHGLFHRFVRSTLSPRDRERASETACRVLVAADPRDPTAPRHWRRYADLIPHLEPSGALESADEDVRSFVLNCVEYLRMRGEYADGWDITRKALDRWRTVSKPTDRTVLVATHQYANMLRRLGRYAEAEDVGRDILERLYLVPEAQGIELLRAMNGLGGTLMALGKYDEAHRLYESATAMAIERLGDSTVPRTLALRSNLAQAIALCGHYEDSLGRHQSIMEARVRLLGPRNALTLLSALHTAWTLRLLGRYPEAFALQERNTSLHSQVLDREHSQTLLAQHNLALCARREGNLPFAKSLMKRVRERVTHRRGSHHPETLLISTDYAMLLRDMGLVDEAWSIAESTARTYAARLGEKHPYAIGARDNCGVILRTLGEHEAARVIGEETRTAMAAVLGADHPWSIGCAVNASSARAATGDPEGAIELGREALERAEDAVGGDHILTAGLKAGLALDLRTTGLAREAGLLTDEVAQMFARTSGKEHGQARFLASGERPYWDFEPQPI